MSKIQGPVFTIFTPFDKSGDVDFNSLESYIEFLANNGARQFYMMPYNGRFSQLTNDEIRRVNAFCIKCVKSDPNNMIIVSDPIHGSTETKLSFAKEAYELGADYLSSLMREKYFCVDQVVDHYATMSTAGIEVVVHAMPFLSGYTGRSMDWPTEVFEALSSVSSITAIKEDSKDVSVTRNLIGTFGERFDVVVAGRKRFLVDALGGAHQAYINGISMVNPHIAHTFWSLLGSAPDEAVAYVERIDDPFWEGVVARFGWHRVNKAALESCGHMSRMERGPMPQLSAADMTLVADATQKILEEYSCWMRESSGAHQDED